MIHQNHFFGISFVHLVKHSVLCRQQTIKTNIHETKQTHPSGSLHAVCRKCLYGTNHALGKPDGDGQ